MSVPIFHVEQPGFLTTVQDRGRVGHQRDGVAVAGALDPFAAQAASILAGNGRGAAVLEITLRGPTLRVLADARVVVCGADLSARLDDVPLPLWRTVEVARGQTIRFGARRSGTRAYLAVSGGFHVPLVLGSRSTALREGVGGLGGRPLRRGDVLSGVPMLQTEPGRALVPSLVPLYETPAVVRVVAGPHRDAFGESVWADLTSGTYLVTPRSDRMGYRLEGARLHHSADGGVLSEAAPVGGLQVPPDGLPILLMADRQTVGGYPLIGVVASAELPRAAQAGPGDLLAFRAVLAEEAEEARSAQELTLRLLAAGVTTGEGCR